MIRKILFFFFVMLSLKAFSQENFEKGYIINNNGDTIDCFILNEDLKNNPKSFKYKLYENSDIIEARIGKISELKYGNSKYKRASVKIDISDSQTNKLDYNKAPNFKEKTLFLKYLVEGKANLYVYEDNNTRLFFYNIDNKQIDQLVHKKYYTTATTLKENNQFKQQISYDLNCNNLKLEDIEKLNYKTTDLTKYFEKYNQCEDSGYTNSILKEKNKGKFNFYVKPSVNFSSLTTENKSNDLGELEFGSKINFGIGLENEFILPFNNGRLGLLVEPTFQTYKSDIEDYIYVKTSLGPQTTSVSIDYKAIDLLIGIKYYFPINDSSSIYVNTLYNFNSIDLGSNFDFETTSLVDLGLKGKNYIALAAGFKFKNKIILETRFSSSQPIITNALYSTSYPRTSIIFGYRIF